MGIIDYHTTLRIPFYYLFKLLFLLWSFNPKTQVHRENNAMHHCHTRPHLLSPFRHPVFLPIIDQLGLQLLLRQHHQNLPSPPPGHWAFAHFNSSSGRFSQKGQEKRQGGGDRIRDNLIYPEGGAGSSRAWNTTGTRTIGYALPTARVAGPRLVKKSGLGWRTMVQNPDKHHGKGRQERPLYFQSWGFFPSLRFRLCALSKWSFLFLTWSLNTVRQAPVDEPDWRDDPQFITLPTLEDNVLEVLVINKMSVRKTCLIWFSLLHGQDSPLEIRNAYFFFFFLPFPPPFTYMHII